MCCTPPRAPVAARVALAQTAAAIAAVIHLTYTVSFQIVNGCCAANFIADVCKCVCLPVCRTNITGRLFYVYIWELPIFVVMAVICGMTGALFVALNIRLRHLRGRMMPWDTPKHWWRSAEVRALLENPLQAVRAWQAGLLHLCR